MTRVVVLGGCGGIGSVASRALAVSGGRADISELVLADARADTARELAERLASQSAATVHGIGVDAGDADSLRAALDGADVVLNCVGPFYRFGPPALRAAIEAGVDYVDICDDLAPTRTMLDLDGDARAAGVHALIGMGNSPGIANVFVRLCADSLLDRVESVDIMHAHGGEPEEGPGVVKHRIHAMLNDVPLFVDGELITVRQLEASGRAFVTETDFRDVGTLPAYPYPHPETITLPRHIDGMRRVTNLGVVFPLSYFHLTQDMVRLGVCTDEPLAVGDSEVVPLEFAVAHILARRPHLLREAGIDGPAGCLKVVVAGTKGGDAHTYVCSLSSRSAGAGEGTGIPAAVGTLLMAARKVAGPGVLPPEAAVDPAAFLDLAFELARQLGVGTGEGTGVHVEHIRPDGTSEAVPLA